jgi:hypothetical protein
MYICIFLNFGFQMCENIGLPEMTTTRAIMQATG